MPLENFAKLNRPKTLSPARESADRPDFSSFSLMGHSFWSVGHFPLTFLRFSSIAVTVLAIAARVEGKPWFLNAERC